MILTLLERQAHRLSSISQADIIFVVKEGVIAEKGTHTELMALNQIYADLVRFQELQKTEV